MSHFTFYAEPEPVATRHGDAYVGIGRDNHGIESVSIVTPGDDSTDLHLSQQQALDLIELLSASVTALVIGDIA